MLITNHKCLKAIISGYSNALSVCLSSFNNIEANRIICIWSYAYVSEAEKENERKKLLYFSSEKMFF